MYAVNLNMPIDAPPRWQGARLAHVGLVFEHYDGGPVQASQTIAMAYIPEASTLPGGSEVESTPPGFVRGPVEVIAAITKHRFKKTNVPTTVHVFWGYAGWGETQMLAEIARGGWGLVEAECHVAVKEGGEDGPYVLARDFAWETIAPLGCFAPKSEYTKYR